MAANSEGVLLMQRHDYEGAMLSFDRAIGTLKAGLLVVDENTSDSMSRSECQQWHPIPGSSSVLSNGQRHNYEDSLVRLDTTNNNELSYLIRQGVTLGVRQNAPSAYCCVEEISTVLYNFGLANHLNGMESGSRKSLERALCLYDLALALIYQDEDKYSGKPPSYSPTMTVVALLNNKGQVQNELGCHYEAHQTFAQLLNEWGRMDRVGHIQRVLDENTCCGLFLNLYMYSTQPKSAAAA